MPYGRHHLRKRCESIISGLDLSHPFSLEGLCARIAEQRGRPIRLHPLPPEAAESGVCGLWVGTASVDYVFFEAKTSRLHREHIVLHELGHILFGHNSLAGEEPDSGVPVILGRTNYTTRQEREAELLASLIRTQAGLLPGRGPQGPLEKLGSALGVRSTDVG
ncbi:hypothetical protein LG634_04085 [Streptomyces bambusae]|uniref:hypothetical protein n=1 Tax=Streptomyces bambusae TaxID=1550616 RepID=UPI001CFDE0C3|nr:hypothetical protein [Streptomyces bambusae]MCB5164015.1 hypothetical protein [Streptomyces bambusae]